jgi:hypothetical protein
MLLAKPPEVEISVTYGDCHIHAAPSTPHVICRFAGATSHAEAYARGSLMLQEALDVLSMTGRVDLVTRDAEDEHLVWWNSDGRRTIALVSTATFSVKVGPVTLTVHDAQGNPVPPKPIIPKHHLGFRYYRLSQASDDLFDAYRNMYLAFESLLSSRYPKSKGQEIDWLRQSLASAASDLSLSDLAPASAPDPVDDILSIVYNGARLPLFHAKDGKAYFAPIHSAADREAVATALTMLTHIVLRMADKWFSARRISGWVNLKIFEDQNRTLFRDCRFVFSDNPAFTLQDDLSSESISNGKPFNAQFREHFGAEVKHHVFGELPVADVSGRGRLHALFLVNNESPLIGLSPDTTVDLEGFNNFQILLFIRGRNASAPKYLYPR